MPNKYQNTLERPGSLPYAGYPARQSLVIHSSPMRPRCEVFIWNGHGSTVVRHHSKHDIEARTFAENLIPSSLSGMLIETPHLLDYRRLRVTMMIDVREPSFSLQQCSSLILQLQSCCLTRSSSNQTSRSSNKASIPLAYAVR